MTRSQALKNIAAILTLPVFVAKAEDKICLNASTKVKRIAIERRALDIPGLTPREILKLYAETGILIYQQPSNAKFPVITVIEK